MNTKLRKILERLKQCKTLEMFLEMGQLQWDISSYK